MSDEDFFNEISADGSEQNVATQTPQVIPAKELVPQTIRISDRCMQMGKMIGPQVQLMSKRALEVGGFYTLKLGDNSFTYTDFIIPNPLLVAFNNIRIDENYDSAAKELKGINEKLHTELRLGAMFHIHPSPSGGLYHSPQDDMALENLVNKMSKTTKRVFESPLTLIESRVEKEYGEDMLCLRGDALSDAIKRFVYPDDQLFYELLQNFGLQPNHPGFKKSEFLAKVIESITDQTYEPRTINFAVSFVFNNGEQDPFVKMGLEETFKISGKTSYTTVSNVPLQIIGVGQNIPTSEEVNALITQRVVFPTWNLLPQRRRRGKKGQPIKGTYGILGGGANGSPNGLYEGNEFGAYGIYNYSSPTNFMHQPTQGTFVTPPKLTVAEKIERLPKPSEEKAGSFAQTVKTFIAGNNFAPTIPTINKTEEPGYTLEEVATRFVLETFSYLNEYRHSHCKYSTYMSALLDEMSTYKRPTLIHGNVYDPTQQEPVFQGINSSILATGEVVQDRTDIVEKPDIRGFRLNYAIDNIVKELEGIKGEQEDTIAFMVQFIKAKTEGRNALLETYTAKVLKEQEQEQND